ncbi:MAG: PA2778 family cysteine peptidase [Candidatus Methylomirabilia bacterium]
MLKRPPAPLLLLVLLVGCATSQTDRLIARGLGALPPRITLLQVRFHPQEAYQCGPAALAMVLNWAGVSIRPEELAPQVYTPGRQGTLQTEIVTASRRHGRIAYPVSTLETLLKEVAAGHPAIVLQNLGLSWYPSWHFAVVIGYDLPRRKLVLHSGLEPRKVVPMRLFERTWARGKNWGVVVLPPEKLPDTAEEKAFLLAAVGLEKAGRWEAAARAYRAALTRWPKSYGALMGFGNSLYASGDLPGAEKAFRAATVADPNAGAAFNNLAQVLLETGRSKEAVAFAMKAVEIGGPLKPAFLRTLEQISGQEE